MVILLLIFKDWRNHILKTKGIVKNLQYEVGDGIKDNSINFEELIKELPDKKKKSNKKKR